LIDSYGQSDSPVTYCVADHNEAWLVETTYRHWIAKRIPENEFYVVANQYFIETEWDMTSEDLINYAINQGWYETKEQFNFKKTYSVPDNMDRPGNTSREFQGNTMLRSKKGSITIKDVLDVLSQPPIQTTNTQSFMVMHLRKNLPPQAGHKIWFGMSGANTNVAVPIYGGSLKIPEEYMESSLEFDPTSAWWQFKKLQEEIYRGWWEYSDRFLEIRQNLDEYQKKIFQESAAIEEEAIELYQQGNTKKANQLLTDHTYRKLEEALKKIKEINNNMK
jgi:secernin